MAAGDRKVVIERMILRRGVPVMADAHWLLYIEDKAGVDRISESGQVVFQLAATGAAFNAMTGSQIKTSMVSAVTADPTVPGRDSIS